MHTLSVNQIMVLLDIYRGTDTQSDNGTITGDLHRLKTMEFIQAKKLSQTMVPEDYKCTSRGQDAARHIQNCTTAFFK